MASRGDWRLAPGNGTTTPAGPAGLLRRRDRAGRQVVRPRRRHAADPLHSLHPRLLQAPGQRLHHCTRVTPAMPLDETPIAPVAHQQVRAADLQRGLAGLPGQQQGVGYSACS